MLPKYHAIIRHCIQLLMQYESHLSDVANRKHQYKLYNFAQ